MTKEEAELIRKIKKGCTYRKLASTIYPLLDDRHGMGWAGEELCEDAFKVPYPNIDLGNIQWGLDASFDQDNKSHFGEFYWWE